MKSVLQDGRRLFAKIARAPRPVDPKLYHRPSANGDAATGVALRLTWLGTVGFALELADRVLALDPFVSRPGLRQTLTGRLRADPARVRRFIPRADDVLIGHAHHDHILDAPTLCRQTGARLIGAPAAAHVARAAWLPDAQIRVTTGGEDIGCGAVTVRAPPSRHGRRCSTGSCGAPACGSCTSTRRTSSRQICSGDRGGRGHPGRAPVLG